MAKSPPTADELAEKLKRLDAEEAAARRRADQKRAALALKMLALKTTSKAEPSSETIEAAVQAALAKQTAAHEQLVAQLKAEHATALEKTKLMLEQRTNMLLGHATRNVLGNKPGGEFVPVSQVRSFINGLSLEGEWAEARQAAFTILDNASKGSAGSR